MTRKRKRISKLKPPEGMSGLIHNAHSKTVKLDEWEHKSIKIGEDGFGGINYESLENSGRIGVGASSKVYRVKDKNGVYALKVVDVGRLSSKNIASEVRSYQSLINDKSHCVMLYDAYFRNGSIQLLLEYMELGSLHDIQKIMGKIPEKILSRITFQLLKGLSFLKKEKILHRDIKPANILLNKHGIAKFGDFGMAKQKTSEDDIFSTFQGSLSYMSPERMKGEEHSYNSDVWSLGISIVECAIGRFPFFPLNRKPEEMDYWETTSMIQKGIQVKEHEISENLMDFLNKCVIHDPKKRPEAEALLDHPWVNADTVEIKQWIQKDYLPARKEKSKIRMELQEKEKN